MSRLDAALRRAQTQNQSAEPERPKIPLKRDYVKEQPRRDRDERLSHALTTLTTPVPAATAEPSDSPSIGGLGSGAEKLVVTARPEQSTVEQYRKLAATLHHAQVQ